MRPIGSILVVTMVVIGGMNSGAVLAQERDSDGTRMQARHVDVGSQHVDELSPPVQQEDWRMIRLDEDERVSVTLEVSSEDREATLTLTDATGDELASETAGDDSAAIAHSLEAGIYYIAVASSESLRYELSIE